MARIASVVFSYYPQEPRTRRQAEALADAGFEVDVFCSRNAGEASFEIVDGVAVHRLPVQKRRGGRLRYIFEYLSFATLCAVILAGRHLRRRYRVIHIHNMPDILVFSALIPKLAGAKVILDLHDPMPEIFMGKYKVERDHPIVGLLRWLEHISTKLADLVITPNIGFRRLFVARGLASEKIEINMNSANERFFQPVALPENPPETGQPRRFVVMCHGTLTERNGLGKAVEAIAAVRDKIPGLVFEVYGDGDYKHQFLRRVEELRLQDIVRFHGVVGLDRIAAAIRDIDVGFIPNVLNPA